MLIPFNSLPGAQKQGEAVLFHVKVDGVVERFNYF
jgi:hypothetical protein